MISRYLTTDDIRDAVLPAYPQLFENIKNTVPVSYLYPDTLKEVRELMLASPNEVVWLILDNRPQNESHLRKTRSAMMSTSLKELVVMDPRWLVGERFSSHLRKIFLYLPYDQAEVYEVDVWSMWSPAFPAPRNITMLEVDADRPSPHAADSPAPACLARSCFQVLDRLETLCLRPPPSAEFWASASDVALGRIRAMALYERGGAVPWDTCSVAHFVDHAARFTNLVELRVCNASDVLRPMVDLGLVLPSLRQFSTAYGMLPVTREIWTRIATLFPSLHELSVKESQATIDEEVFTKVLPSDFAQLRTIELYDCGLSLMTCLTMVVQMLMRHPQEPMSIICTCLGSEVTADAGTVWDSLSIISSLIPSCSVRARPQGDQEFDGYFSLHS